MIKYTTLNKKVITTGYILCRCGKCNFSFFHVDFPGDAPSVNNVKLGKYKCNKCKRPILDPWRVSINTSIINGLFYYARGHSYLCRK